MVADIGSQGELKKTADETLFRELARRGYDISKLRNGETTTKIIKHAVFVSR